MEDIELQLRSNYNVYSKFMEWFVSCIVCKESFRRNASVQLLSTFISVSDEAMAMLILKNNYNLWKEIGIKIKTSGEKIKIDECQNKQLYFCEGKGRGRSWSNEGRTFYNTIYSRIAHDRQTNQNQFDKMFLDEKGTKEGSRRKREEAKMNTVVECYSDFSAPKIFKIGKQSNEYEHL
jgi:hypothetical protein